MNGQIQNTLNKLPSSPGIYQFIDNTQTIIYVGKAKNIKNRVSSYFSTTKKDAKTHQIVHNAVDIKYFIVQSETEALFLENTLIKKYQPKYNILLKDSKTYPWICIKKEPFPRIFSTKQKNSTDTFFGPYISSKKVRALLQLIKSIYPIRSCKFHLSKQNIQRGKFKVCLDYHIKKCMGPCEDKQSEEEYNTYIEDIKKILKGDIQEIITIAQHNMFKYANKLDFEHAQEEKEKIEILKEYTSKTSIFSSIKDCYIFGISIRHSLAVVNYMKIRKGTLEAIQNIEIENISTETPETLLTKSIIKVIQETADNITQIITPIDIAFTYKNIKCRVPKIGDKKKALDISIKNASEYLDIMQAKHTSNLVKYLHVLKEELALKTVPIHIECFDNSNIQGQYPVASCVVFRYGKPKKTEYRKFKIQTVQGIDDFSSMKEIVYRRYNRMLKNDVSLPNLIVIDGGKGQLSSAKQSLKALNIIHKVDCISIAKKEEMIFSDTFPNGIHLKNHHALNIIRHARDEAHRFAITFHRQLRSKGFIDQKA